MSSNCDIEISLDFCDGVEVLALCECEVVVSIDLDFEIDVQAFDYPPELDRLNALLGILATEVDECDEMATDALALANAAGQAAAEALGAASNAVSLAGEAIDGVQGIVDATTPLSNVNIPSLAEDATYDADTLTYLKALFSNTIPQGVREHIVKVWAAINTPPKSYEIAYNPDGSVSQISYEGGDVITYSYSQGQVSSWSDGNRTWTVVKDIDGNIININIS